MFTSEHHELFIPTSCSKQHRQVPSTQSTTTCSPHSNTSDFSIMFLNVESLCAKRCAYSSDNHGIFLIVAVNYRGCPATHQKLVIGCLVCYSDPKKEIVCIESTEIHIKIK
ncbi:uncharacterized protein G2W53_038539 [Senna tora]|uniref:Uncharacterized protein n=1 Tax=Senna tora TaxID=362788 RepID=A0A834SL84_9FABA|nr:uncharacterized protein G2W53_038539 [Senna tora]